MKDWRTLPDSTVKKKQEDFAGNPDENEATNAKLGEKLKSKNLVKNWMDLPESVMQVKRSGSATGNKREYST